MVKKNNINVGIVGAGGYAGVNLFEILASHPKVQINFLISEKAHEGKKMSELFPHTTNIAFDITIKTLDDLNDTLLKGIDVVFLALPHGIAMNYVPKLLKKDVKVVDLGADYRFNDAKVFEKWYSTLHTSPEIAKEAVFGLPEINISKIKNTNLIANPGCYPTASLLALLPLIENKLIDFSSIFIDAKSGVSGAGRSVSLKTLYCERNEGVAPYAVISHRHRGEVEYQLSVVAKGNITLTFTPHLIPMTRGILTTCYTKLLGKTNKAELISLYQNYYKKAPFVRILIEVLPCTKFVWGTNFCDIGLEIDEEQNRLIIASAIDNLVKGASGQAVQNMNIMLGFPEEEGLRKLAIYP